MGLFKQNISKTTRVSAFEEHRRLMHNALQLTANYSQPEVIYIIILIIIIIIIIIIINIIRQHARALTPYEALCTQPKLVLFYQPRKGESLIWHG